MALIAALLAGATAFLEPAPVYLIDPKPFEYQNWLPHPGSGFFHNLNRTISPEKALPHHPAACPPPNGCDLTSTTQDSFWMANLDAVNNGTSPFLANGQDYKVFRNVMDYGAKGDGVTDDTNAINEAISWGGRISGGNGAGGTTGQPALIYFPPGTYLISFTMQLFINTQVIGDAINMPTIKIAGTADNNTVVVGGYDPGQGSTTNFYIGLRNFNIDTTAANPDLVIYGLNWAVSQATSLTNVHFNMPQGSNHVGIEMDGGTSGGGSGLSMGDITFNGGSIGLIMNNQQYSLKNLKFSNCKTGIAVQHAFVITLQGIECDNVGICVDMGGSDVSGSTSLIDSSCNKCGSVINGTSSILLENIAVTNSGATLTVNGTSVVNSTLEGKTYVQGHIYRNNQNIVARSTGSYLPYTERGNLVDSTGKYFTKILPQYEGLPASAFVSVKDVGAKGDGQTDDTLAIQSAITTNAGCKIIFFPHGVYLVTDTIYVPPDTRIVGQVWSTISASGANFNDSSAPRPMIRVGNPGEVGLAEFTDMLFTVADVLPGCILVEVNMKGTGQGDVSFHNSHYRIGGAADSLTETACQTVSEPCPAAFMLTHLREGSSTYIEDAWLWTADHDLDNLYTQQIGTGRGMLVESTEGTWLVGTGSEHHTLYAYQFNNAANVYAALMQVETPYWQPSPEAPAPWVPNATWSDPTFEGCDKNISQCYMQWALRITGAESHTLPIYGIGAWVFFNGPNYGGCTGPNGTCQINIVDLEDLTKGSAIEIYNLNTRGVQNMVTLDGSGGFEAATQQENQGSWGGVLAGYLGYM